MVRLLVLMMGNIQADCLKKLFLSKHDTFFTFINIKSDFAKLIKLAQMGLQPESVFTTDLYSGI